MGNHNIIRNVFDDISPYDNLNDPACQEDDAIVYRQMHGYIANNIVLHSAGNAISLRCNTGGTQEAPLYVVNNTISNVKGTGITYSGNDGPTGCSSGGCDVNAPAQTIEFLYTLNNIITCGADPLEFYDSGILESDATSIPPRPCRIGSTNWVDYNLTYMPNSNDPPGCPKNAWWVNVGLSNDTINNSGLTPDPNDPPRNPQGPNMFYIYPPLYLINTGSLGPPGDYHLDAESQAVNRGISLETLCVNPNYSFLCLDFDRVPRPQGGAFDLGAYERPENQVFRVAHN